MFQWVGPVENMEEEFDKIDKNGGGQILFSEFVDWALEKDLDIEDDVEPEDWIYKKEKFFQKLRDDVNQLRLQVSIKITSTTQYSLNN